MTCPAHRPRPVGPPRLQPSGFTDTVLRCEACGEVSVRTTWGEGLRVDNGPITDTQRKAN